jgi:diguanylate cyclase (GGDEF)-like protein/PAS domain S-box-containing protein
MTDQPSRRTRLTRSQKIGGLLLVGLVVGANLVNVSISRSLSRTNGQVSEAGETMTTVANAGREANFIAVAAAQFPDRRQFDSVSLHHALLVRQIAVTHAKLEGRLPTRDAVAEVDLRLGQAEKTLTGLGTDPARAELRRARIPMRAEAEALELATKHLYDGTELELFKVGRRAMLVQSQYQVVLVGMGLFTALVTLLLLTSLRRRAGKDLAKAYDDLLGETQERRLAEEGLRRSNAHFRALVHNASDVITVLDRDLRITYQSPSTAGVRTRDTAHLVGTDFLALVDEADRALARDRLADSAAHPGTPVRAELRLRSGDTPRLHEVTICSLLDDPAVEGVVLNYRDVTERVQFQRELERLAYADVLTGLPNRGHLQSEIERITRDHEDVAVLFIDLDAFKVVNDSLGHAAGDQLLQAVARRLAGEVRGGDLLARLGGDEFTVVVTGARVESVEALAERLILALSEPYLLDDQVAFVGASIGIATTQDGERSPVALLRNADAAMYRAKATGRNRHVLFTSALHDDAVNRLVLETDLRGAITAGQLELHYQPIASLSSGRVESVETLLRWRRSPDVLVSPLDFIRVAEEVGLMGAIGRWVLREACRQRVEWGREGACADDLAISVNLSPHQFKDATLVADISGILAETGLPPSLLVLEITESAIIGDIHGSRTVLHELRDMGVRVALDDFGTGYSSLTHLSDLPIDTIKIDRSFVAGMCVRSQDALIIEAVITLSHSLDMSTVAEGVETPEQLAALRVRGCDGVQGYLLSRPLPAGQVPGMLADVQGMAARPVTGPARSM